MHVLTGSLFFCLAAARAEEPAEILRDRAPSAATLAGGQSRRYSVALEAGSTALVRVDQRGVDVSVATFLPSGRPGPVVDSPNGAFGPEWVELRAATAGDYALEVRSIEPGAPSGAYEVRVVAVVPRLDTAEQRMDWDLARYSATDAPGLAIAVARDGATVYRKAFGSADLEHGVPIAPTTVFDVASVSKQFTAFAALLLAADGRLSLDDDAHRYLPELAIDRPITLRQLAQHTSGLRDFDELLWLSGVSEQDAVTTEEAVALICRQRGLNFEPGTTFEYSNSGFILLAEVVARVSGKPFPEFARERIFAPLGMTSTQFVDDPTRVVRDRAFAYGPSERGYALTPINHGVVGSTGLHTTVDDLLRWAQNFTDPVVGDRALIAEMERPGRLTTGEPLTYGLGLDRKSYRGQEVLFHGGGEAGYRSYIVRAPERGFAVAITANAEELNPLAIANQAMDHFLLADAPLPAPRPARRTKPAPIEGDYELFPGQILTVSRDRRDLWLRGNHDDAPVRLQPVTAREFMFGDAFHRLSFPEVPPGSPRAVRYHIFDFTWTGREIALRPVEAGGVRGADLAGRYHSDELGVDLTVAEVDGGLVVRGHRFGDLVMTPFQPDQFTTPAGYASLLAFVRDPAGAVTGLDVSGSRARGVRFERAR